MSALGIVEPLDVVADRRDCRLCRLTLLVDKLTLPRRKEALCNGVISVVTGATHAGSDATITQRIAVTLARVEASTAQVMLQVGSRLHQSSCLRAAAAGEIAAW